MGARVGAGVASPGAYVGISVVGMAVGPPGRYEGSEVGASGRYVGESEIVGFIVGLATGEKDIGGALFFEGFPGVIEGLKVGDPGT